MNRHRPNLALYQNSSLFYAHIIWWW